MGKEKSHKVRPAVMTDSAVRACVCLIGLAQLTVNSVHVSTGSESVCARQKRREGRQSTQPPRREQSSDQLSASEMASSDKESSRKGQ